MGNSSSHAYVELHARSAFSFLRGASQPADLARVAAQVGLPALAVVDRDGFYGSPRLWLGAGEAGIRAHYGCELTLEDGAVLPLLIRTVEGYQSVCRLLTRSKLRAPKGKSVVYWDELVEIAGGVICLTGDEEGPLHNALLRRDFARAEATLRRLLAIFGVGNVYVEVQRHLRRGERWLNQRLVELARTTGADLLATNGVLSAEPAGRRVVDVFTCARLHLHLDEAGTALAVNAERHLKSPAQMQALFADLPDALANTVRLAERLEFAFPCIGYEFPTYPNTGGMDADAYLRQVTYAGARWRYGRLSAAVRRQLDTELNLIIKLGFTGYFLLVWDVVNSCRDKKILVQGRGSAANSTSCYCLGITAIDPIANKLLFERFLNENRGGEHGGRKTWPDIDLDLPSGERREQVIQRMYERYTRCGVAMTANVISFQGRSTMREIGKALNLPANVLDLFSSLFHPGDFPETLELQSHFEQAGLARTHPRARACLELYQAIHGLPRHLGQHSGGMVICQGRLDSVVPLENSSMPNRSVLQWDKNDCEDLGLVKIDFLGLGMMAVIQDTLELCQQRAGRQVDWNNLPTEDKDTYDTMCASDTIGVFQVESRAQMATLARLQPRSLYDVAIQVAIVRPGPIEGGLVHPYLARRADPGSIKYLDPRLAKTLERTMGVCLFQEQMMSIAMDVGNFSGAEVDELRRALNFTRDAERLPRIQTKLRAALLQNGISAAGVEEIITMTKSFGCYGFPESHALSFGYLAYASTYLKVHRGVEFTAALLNNQPMGFYAPPTLIRDARAHGIHIRPICVQQSAWPCTAEADDVLRLGFNQVQGFRQEHAAELIRQRALAPFRSLHDFRTRVPLTKEELRSLARLGALNCFCGHRRTALWEVEREIPREENYCFRFDEDPAPNAPASPLQPMNPVERMQADYRTQRLTTGPHPMKFMRGYIPEVWRASDVGAAPHGDTITIAGAVICRQRPGTAKGFVFISLEDETGIANAVVTPDLFERDRLTITQENFLRITGPVQTRQGLPLVRAQHIERLTCAPLEGLASHDFH